MSTPRISRRHFLGTSLVAGAGALAASGPGGAAWASVLARRPSTATVTPPPAPVTTRTYVSRPDLTPPGVSITQYADVASIPGQPQYIFLTPRPNAGSSQPIGSQGLLICDLAGDTVYFRQEGTATDTNPFNFRVQTYQGRPVLTYYTGTAGIGYGVDGTGTILDDTYSPIATTSTDLYRGQDLHEFLLTPEDTALVTSYESKSGLIYGHALEIDVASGDVLFDWSSETECLPAHSYTGSTGDYFHINSVDLWPGSARDLLVSARNMWTVYLVDRATGRISWQIGGRHPSFTMHTGTAFSYQHDARALDNGTGISLFDDASQPDHGERQSWGKVFDVSPSAASVTLRHEFDHPDGLIDTPSQGNNQLLATNAHFVGFGAVPYFTLFGPPVGASEPPVLLDGRLPGNASSYRALMGDWTAHPPESEIALVVRPGAGTGTFTAYMSWNGATEVDSWRINAGTSPMQTKLATVERKKKVGFETVIAFTRSGATEFQAVALDATGTALGRSKIVTAAS